ncbi:MAG: DUF4338 domain-containing protein [Acidimicrobiia bacterium]|nr:DUF4338 domain-containing protein [Acidimicrobiia bacterium]
MTVALTYSGRRFSTEDLDLMRQAANDYAALGITEIARTVCQWLDWKRPNGRLKNHECRLLLERLRDEGFLSLPALRHSGKRGPRILALTGMSDTQPPIHATTADLQPLTVRLVSPSEGRLFRQLIQRYHYLGYRTPVGANLRYFIESRDGRLLACLLWSSPGWKMAARDRWIGWNATQRKRNLQYLVNNSRFLILPWVQVKGLASAILSCATRQLPLDWQRHYGYRPVLLETLVDSTRFRGTSYRAANWICLGETAGRGRMDRYHQRQETTKLIFVFPIHRKYRELLHATKLTRKTMTNDRSLRQRTARAISRKADSDSSRARSD